ncbi:hypothetical protein ES703_58103 [subsurface metagenome]
MVDKKNVAIGLGIGVAVVGTIIAVTRKVKAAPPEPPPGLANIYGVVTDAISGKPLANVSVTLWDHTKVELLLSALTDNKGYYSMLNISPISCIVEFEKEGYRTISESYALTEGNNEINIALVQIGWAGIGGIVTDATTGRKLMGVLVQTAYEMVMTGSNGRYTLVGLELGEHLMRFSKEGYQTAERTIMLTEQGITVNVALVAL